MATPHPAPRPSARLLCGAFAAVLVSFGCATDRSAEAVLDRAADAAADEPKEVAPAERALAKAERELAAAELGAQLEELEAQAKQADAEEELRAARAALDAARLEREAFEGEADLRRRRAANEVTEGRSRLTSEQADLAGIRAIYALEPEATAKDEILRRHEESVKRAEEELALSLIEAERLEAVELAAERRELDEAVLAAEAEALSKVRALDAAKLSARKAVEGARNEVLEARDAVAEAREELAEARK